MDKEAAKSAIKQELVRRVTFSGGPEVFRHFLRTTPDIVEAALRDLVAEGVVKETVLRVGRIYAYPPSVKASHDYLTDQLTRMANAEPRPVRAPHAATAVPRATPPAAGQAVTAAPTGPIRAVKKSALAEGVTASAAPGATSGAGAAPPAAPAGSFTGPVRAKKRSEMTPEELAAAGLPAPPPLATAAPADAAAPATAPPPGGFTGPVRAQKKSAMTPEEIEAAVEAAKARAAARDAAPPSETPPGGFTGPVRAKKKSEMEAEEAIAASEMAADDATASPAASPGADETPAAPATPAVPPPGSYTGPIRARKKSEMPAEE